MPKVIQRGLHASRLNNGDKRIRTADPFNAIEVLYQLSYIPAAFSIMPDVGQFRQAKLQFHVLTQCNA